MQYHEYVKTSFKKIFREGKIYVLAVNHKKFAPEILSASLKEKNACSHDVVLPETGKGGGGATYLGLIR